VCSLELFRPFLADPALQLAAVLMMLYGAFNASVMHYVPTLAVNAFGLGDAGYALVLVAASIVAIASAVGMGILADQRASRWLMAILAASAFALGLRIGGYALVAMLGAVLAIGGIMLLWLLDRGALGAAALI